MSRLVNSLDGVSIGRQDDVWLRGSGVPVSGSLFILFSGCLNPVTSVEQRWGKLELDSISKVLVLQPALWSRLPSRPEDPVSQHSEAVVQKGEGELLLFCLTRHCQQAGEYVSLVLFLFG